jgi:hypothetical protein
LALKLLTATNAGQGLRDNDFDWCVEGELVHIGMVCARDWPVGVIVERRLDEIVVRQVVQP